MSSGGGFAPSQGSSNVSTNSTPTTSQTAPAPSGGKGGYNNSPMKMEDFAQQQPQVYMPPAQPTFYDQAFTNSYYNPGFQRPRMDYGLGGMGNAYARRAQFRSQSSPFDAPKPPGEMQYSGQYAPQAPAGLQNNPDYVPPYAGPTNQTPQYGGPGAVPVEATRGVASDNINNPAYQQQMVASNMTDYQRLMQRKNSASAGPYVNPLTGEVGGVNPFAQVSDLEIANSLGYKDPSANMMSDDRARMPFDANLGLQGLRQQMAAAGTLGQSSQNEKAKEYLNSIGYGQAGFDASKYEVKRQPVSTGPRTGLGALLGGY
jgi:hypothetical protein